MDKLQSFHNLREDAPNLCFWDQSVKVQQFSVNVLFKIVMGHEFHDNHMFIVLFISELVKNFDHIWMRTVEKSIVLSLEQLFGIKALLGLKNRNRDKISKIV